MYNNMLHWLNTYKDLKQKQNVAFLPCGKYCL